MRISIAILLIVTILLPVGCNSDLRCRRETALLRAEYLDLEDKYYSLLAQSEGSTTVDGTASVASGYENAVIIDSGLPVDSGYENGVVISSGQPVGSGIILDQGSVSSNLANPEITYYDHSPGYQSISPSDQCMSRFQKSLNTYCRSMIIENVFSQKAKMHPRLKRKWSPTKAAWGK